jgi:DNA-binding NtrC family response regulator
VEDDSRLRRVLRKILEGLNYSVLDTGDGATALAILEEEPRIRMVLSDVMLIGGTSGVALEKEIRRRRPEMEVLLMSGYAAEELAKAGHCGDQLDLLTKPFTRPVVARRIRAALARRSVAQ